MTDGECIFCSVVAGKVPAKKVYEDESVLAFLDINPRNPGHTLVVPKKHFETIFDMPDSEAVDLFKVVKQLAVKVKAGTNAQGISIAQSNGKAAGQMIPHAHFHVIPRFLTEGPVGLESILPTKRLEEGVLDKIADAIKGAEAVSEEEKVVEEFKLEEKGPGEEKKEKKEKEEEISFDF